MRRDDRSGIWLAVTSCTVCAATGRRIHFKRTTALGFYKIMNALGANTVYNHADYRLMSRRALEGLAEFSEVNLFLRGIVPMIGYPSDVVYYDRKERAAGESKYPLKRCWLLRLRASLR